MGPNTLKFLRTQSPRHFEGGDWNEGGKCHRHKPLGAEEVCHHVIQFLIKTFPNPKTTLNLNLKDST